MSLLPTDDDRESMSIVETEVLADFDPGEHITVECVRLDAPARISAPGEWVYRRKEP